MKIKDYEFGFADATKELTRTPRIFDIAFCDTRNIVDNLLHSYPFILIGRKGVGKSAYSSKIQYMSRNNDIVTIPMNLSDFEFSTFQKTGIDSDISGTQKYKISWDFILLLAIYRSIFNRLQITEVEKVNNIIYLLDRLGFSLDDEYKADVTKLSKLKVGFGVGIAEVDAEFKKEFNTIPATYLERLSILVDKMLAVLNDVYLNNKEIIIIIDGLDDILRYKKNKMEIIASLIRSADYINDKLQAIGKEIKTIILIREDIISMVNDPDLNKIVQDGAISLSWNNRLDELKQLVDLRFSLTVGTERCTKCWDNIFPPKIRGKSSWLYMLEYTLYKPRDVLQFLKYCQKEYPENEKLSLSEFQNVLKVYSNKYFIEEMKNELAGFIDDEIVIAIPTVFRKLGGRGFEISEICRLFEEQLGKKKSDVDTIKALLMYLFEAGYIGQLVSNGRDNKQSVIFKYRNPTARIDYYQKFITHKGLHSGLGVRL